ncbi:DNA translocase FtsK [Candidatus Chazhemtobacterium aquaticus]|uniref:DNA translocase FtsK n=1 Tax=Candidatus Chazhemtobacterium aquaticus TaxID=2715735 RepID=A0A857NA56_9BACT|nr:DNA translocase FtsK [Candidatus Chazhemtobacterium aquaticus]QHO63270.1 DNA translocase FtsK [Candidatus Chazhemtobacterium aquaticus]
MARKRGRRSKPFKLSLKQDTLSSIAAIIIISFGGLISISFSRQGPVLTKIFDIGSSLFGWALIFLPFIFISGGLLVTKVKWQISKPNVFLGSLISLLSLTGLTQAGNIGDQVFGSIAALITSAGSFLFFLSGTIIGILILFETSIEDLLALFQKMSEDAKKASSALPKPGRIKQAGVLPSRELKIKGIGDDGDKTKTSDSPAVEESTSQPQALSNQPGDDSAIWEAPPVSLLQDAKVGKADRGDVRANARIIEDTLEAFGITAKTVEINAGPAVTQYAIEVAIGTKLSKIVALQNDLALALSAPQGQIRIEAPIPGRNLVGIEVPNHSLEFVNLKQMLVSDVMKTSKSKLTVALGLNVAGEPTVADITKMPHVLIAGATGSGKSVAINAFIASILFRASPAEVKFILVDPKRVELTGYDGIPHLLTPVITDPEKVVSALKWSLQEMERRYKLFAEVKVRNIAAYNELSGFQAMPYIVIVIDELADIMLFAPSEVEDSITRIAQMARAVGIHLVLATQRPSTDVITGLIKANIPCRIAFNVASMIDSRVILDSPGAEKLLGRGDMLYIPPDQAKPRRIQGTFVDDKEIASLIEYLKQQGLKPEYSQEVIETKTVSGATAPNGATIDDVDDLFEDAVRVCVNYDKASASLLQRRLSIGYARAARILDQLQKAGVVSAPDGSKPRDVLIKSADEFFARIQSDE